MGTVEETVVRFDPNPLQCPGDHILVANDSAAVVTPHTSRRINFVDDGKLFEGHFTLQAGNLKSIIQILVDQQAEQRVIINDLQDQVNTLRQQTARIRKSRTTLQIPMSGEISIKSIPRESESLERRVKVLEGFRSLWGVRAEDVEALMNTYGDSVVTPEEYTKYIMNLQPMRAVQSEVRRIVAAHAEQQRQLGRAASGWRGERAHGSRGSRHDDFHDAPEGDSQPPDESGPHVIREEVQSGRGDSRGPRHPRRRQTHDSDPQPPREEASVASRGDFERGRDGSRGSRQLRNRLSQETEVKSSREEDYRDAHDDGPSVRDDSRGSRSVRRHQPHDDGRRSPCEDAREARDDVERGRDDSRGSRRHRGRQPHEGDSKPFRDGDIRPDRGAHREARDRGTYDGLPSPRGGPARDTFDDGAIHDLSKRLHSLEEKMRSVLSDQGCVTPGPTSEQGPLTSGAPSTVDVQAREDIDDLGRFVAKRFRELERSIAKLQAGEVSNAARGAVHGGKKSETPPKQREGSPPLSAKPPGETAVGSSAPTAVVEVEPVQKSRKARESSANRAPVVDDVARDDAAAALEQVEQLEKYVIRKLKELTPSAMKQTSALSASSPAPGSCSTQPPEQPSTERQATHSSDRPFSERVAVDYAAREDTSRLFELVHDLEDDWGKRWASLEERLRLIGRAAVNKGTVQTSTPGTIDRRAREDASISLMRVQQLEREIASFRRLLMKQHGSSGDVGPFEGRMQQGSVASRPVMADERDQKGTTNVVCAELAAALDSVESRSRVLALEKEVESRMEDVNRVLATLHTANFGQDFSNLNLLGDGLGLSKSIAPSQIVINTKGTADTPASNAERPTSAAKTYAAMLVMSSFEPAQPFYGSYPKHDQGSPVVLRAPQTETFGTPLVRRETLDKLPTLPTEGGTVPSVTAVENVQLPLQKTLPHSDETVGLPLGLGVHPIRMSGPAPQPPDVLASHPIVPQKPGTAQQLNEARAISSRVRLGGSARAGALNMLGRETGSVMRAKAELGFVGESSALGHRTPCIVPNCAWCAVQNVKVTVKTAR